MVETSSNKQPCPCGSGKSLGQCCGPYLQGTHPAPTAEALMRSRYSAYVLGNEDYLKASWATETFPGALELDKGPRWCGLQIVNTEQGRADDDEGSVEFIATYLEGDHLGQLHELSRFARQERRWVYVDGDIQPGQAPVKIARNEPCPCGSGKKFKRCCAP